MTHFWRYTTVLLVLALTACGFHLKGLSPDDMRPLPFQTLFLNVNGSLAGEVRTQLKVDKRITLVNQAQGADATLNVYGEQTRKDVLTINSAGKINQYLLIYRINARLTVKGQPYEPLVEVRVRRTLNYTDSEVLGKDQEEAMLWVDMHKDAADQIVRRLSYLKPGSEASQPAGETSAPTATRKKPK